MTTSPLTQGEKGIEAVDLRSIWPYEEPQPVDDPEPEPLPATKARVGQQTGGKTRGRKMLVSLAGTMNKRGISPEAIEAALLAENAAKCDPPLPEAKVRSIAADIVKRYPPGEPIAPVVPALLPMKPEGAAKITGELLETCRAWIRRYIVVSDEQAVVMATWILHTYVFSAAEVTPYVHITAPERACGKSRLMEVLEALAFDPISSGGTTAAALVRGIAAKPSTVFLDEMDALFKGNKESAEAIRGILNAGYCKGKPFRKCNPTSYAIEEFDAFCPKCFAGIGHLPDTVASRSIVIEMRRKLPGETVEPFRQRAVKEAALPIKRKLKVWGAEKTANLLSEMRPAPIAGLSDRQNDIAEPLLAIAQLAGDEWLQRLTVALLAVFKAACVEDGSRGVTLLDDIRAVFDERKTDTIPSAILAGCLCKIEGRAWAEWNHGAGMTPNNLARQLKKYKVYPGKIRLGPTETAQSYRRGDFEDVWPRYCPTPPTPTGTPEQPASLLAETAFCNRNTLAPVPVAKSASNPHEQRTVPVVPVQNREDAVSEVRI